MNRRLLFVCAAAFLLVPALAVVIAPPARADYASNALWQLGISGNCVNPSVCTPLFGGTFGFWGWIVLNSDGTGQIVVTDYSYARGSTANTTTIQADLTWDTGQQATGRSTGTFWIESAVVQKVVGPGTPMQMSFPFNTGVPAAAGNYKTFIAPGWILIFQVAKVGT